MIHFMNLTKSVYLMDTWVAFVLATTDESRRKTVFQQQGWGSENGQFCLGQRPGSLGVLVTILILCFYLSLHSYLEAASSAISLVLNVHVKL